MHKLKRPSSKNAPKLLITILKEDWEVLRLNINDLNHIVVGLNHAEQKSQLAMRLEIIADDLDTITADGNIYVNDLKCEID